MQVKEMHRPESATAARRAPVNPVVRTATGEGIRVLGAHKGKKYTVLNTAEGTQMHREIRPRTASYDIFMRQLSSTRNARFGLGEHLDAAVISSTRPVSELNREAVADTSELFAEAVAHELGMPDTTRVLILPREGARVLAHSINEPATEGHDVAYLNLDPKDSSLRGAAVLTHEGWIAPYEDKEGIDGEVKEVLGHTIKTFRQGGLDVATIVVEPVVLMALGKDPQNVLGKGAPQIVARASNERSIDGDMYAASQLANPEGQRLEVVSGIPELAYRRSR